MNFADIATIAVNHRQRRERPRGFIQKLKDSIVSKGLLHPIVLSSDGSTLVAGEGRLIAINELHTDGIKFNFQGQSVAVGAIPFVTIGDLTPDMIAEAELEENIIRATLTWQEESEAKVMIYKMRQKQNPAITRTAVAKEIAEIKVDLDVDPTPGAIEVERQALNKALLVSEHLHNPRVRAAKTLHEASRIVLDDLENKFKAQLFATQAHTSAHRLIKGDLCSVLPGLPAASFDTIIADPPYGINADTYKTVEDAGTKKVHGGHHYVDDIESHEKLCLTIFREGFRLLRSQGLIFMFCDPDRFHRLREMAQVMAFSVWRTPIIWHKTGAASGFAPWGAGGFIRSYEMLLLASKGRKILAIPGGPDVIESDRVHHTKRLHAAEKPVDIYLKLIQRTSIPGDSILDPCCGSGPIFPAATTHRVIATGIEIDPDYHAMAATRLLPAEEAAE